MSVDSKAFQQPMVSTGTYTSACPLADVTETLGYSPSMVIHIEDINATNPNIQIAHSASTTQSLSINGADGVITTPLVASGLDITATGFIVKTEEQTASNVNAWIAFR